MESVRSVIARSILDVLLVGELISELWFLRMSNYFFQLIRLFVSGSEEATD